MPQLLLPIFPDAVTPIKGLLSVGKQDGQIVYFHGILPVFSHAQEDLATFRMITAQLIAQGHLRVVDVSRAFGVPALSVKRALKRYRQEGPKGFYVPPRRRGRAVLTAEVLQRAQALFDGGETIPRVAAELGITIDTLSKAVRAGRLHVAVVKESCPLVSSTKSARDSEAPMGVAASNVPARVAASVGGLSAVAPQFRSAVDVPRGGVLFALPALLAVGLLEGAGELPLPPGYYGIDSLLMLIAFMALARLKSVESLRSCAPGEWGKLLGLDRIPEVRTLREKIGLLSQGARDQTEEIPDTARVVNPARRSLDGQVRSLTSKLSRRLAQFGALNLDETIDPAKVESCVAKKAAAHDEIEQLQEELKTLKEQRKETPSHLDAKDLPEESRFRRLSTHSKQLRHAHDDRLPCGNGNGQHPGTASCPPG